MRPSAEYPSADTKTFVEQAPVWAFIPLFPVFQTIRWSYQTCVFFSSAVVSGTIPADGWIKTQATFREAMTRASQPAIAQRGLERSYQGPLGGLFRTSWIFPPFGVPPIKAKTISAETRHVPIILAGVRIGNRRPRPEMSSRYEIWVHFWYNGSICRVMTRFWTYRADTIIIWWYYNRITMILWYYNKIIS